MPEADCTTTYLGLVRFPGYCIGDDGSVWSCRPQNQTGPLRKEFTQMKPIRRKPRQYVYVKIFKKQYGIHQLVLEAFCGLCPKDKEPCHFPDRSPSNNALTNLRYGTRKENQADARAHGTYTRGEIHGQSKLSKASVVLIRNTYEQAKGTKRKAPNGLLKMLAIRHHVTEHTIRAIIGRRNWKHV